MSSNMVRYARVMSSFPDVRANRRNAAPVLMLPSSCLGVYRSLQVCSNLEVLGASFLGVHGVGGPAVASVRQHLQRLLVDAVEAVSQVHPGIVGARLDEPAPVHDDLAVLPVRHALV